MSAHTIHAWGYPIGAAAVLVGLLVAAFLSGRGRRQRATDMAWQRGYTSGHMNGYREGHRAAWEVATQPRTPVVPARHASTEVLPKVRDDATWFINRIGGGS